MGQMKRILTEIAETARLDELEDLSLDFESQNNIDPDWWRDQDAEMTQTELDALEIQAEVQDLRCGDWI